MLTQAENDLFLGALTIAVVFIFGFAIFATLFALFSPYLPRSFTQGWKRPTSESDKEKTPSPTRKANTGLIGKKEIPKLTSFCRFSRRDEWGFVADAGRCSFCPALS